MAGMSISLLKLDDELKEMIDAPCYSPFLNKIINKGGFSYGNY